MKSLLIVGIFLGSALTVSAQTLGPIAQCDPASPLYNWAICITASSGGQSASGSNTNRGPYIYTNSTQPSTAGAQSGYALTRTGLTPQTAPYAGYAINRNDITSQNAATRGFGSLRASGFVAPATQALDDMDRANDQFCNRNFPVACTCERGETYSRLFNRCTRLWF